MAEEMMMSTSSLKQSVEFLNILDQYPVDTNMKFCIKFNDYTIQEGDRIALYKLGWSEVKDYVLFEWVPTDIKEKEFSFNFNKLALPQNSQDLYQLCYISGDNLVQGASTAFHFYHNVLSRFFVNYTKEAWDNVFRELFDQNSSENSAKLKAYTDKTPFVKLDKSQQKCSCCLHCKPILDQHETDIDILKDDFRTMNQQFTKTLLDQQDNINKIMAEHRKLYKSYRTIVGDQQNEIQKLRTKIQEGGEEYKKLYLEKAKIENKYEKLKSKRGDRKTSESGSSSQFDIGDLQSLPQFPANVI